MTLKPMATGNCKTPKSIQTIRIVNHRLNKVSEYKLKKQVT